MGINVLEIGALILVAVLYVLDRKGVDFSILTLIATAFGVGIGLVFRENYTYVAAFGTVYEGTVFVAEKKKAQKTEKVNVA